MPVVHVNNLDIAYESFGDSTHPTILLIHGLSTPLTGWPMLFVEQLVNGGFHVLRFDNRDVGQSQQLDHLAIPNLYWTAIKIKCGFKVKVPYKLNDMVADTVALLDALSIDNAHIVGASMGGMIAQLLAIEHPERVLSLTSIMSTTGNRKLKMVKPQVMKKLMSKPKSTSLEDQLSNHLAKWRLVQSPKYPSTEAYLSAFVSGLVNRGIYFRGMLRQILAIIASGNREKQLAKLAMPVLVIHGDEDILVPVEGGLATAKAIAHAKLKIYEGMGHDFPVQLMPSIAQDIIEHIHQG